MNRRNKNKGLWNTTFYFQVDQKILFVTCINKGAFKIIQTLATPLGCQPEIDDKKLLLMIPQP